MVVVVVVDVVVIVLVVVVVLVNNSPPHFSKAMAAQISRLKNPHTSLHTYAKNVPEATWKKIYKAANGL